MTHIHRLFLPLRLALAISLSLLMAACGSLPLPKPEEGPAPTDTAAPTAPERPETEPAPEAAAAAAPAPSAREELSSALLYDILLGEIAGQRGRLDVSLPHYLQAAKESQDPRVAERALRIALYAKEHDGALHAARRWVELAPEDAEARQALAALALRKGLVDEALEQLDFLLVKVSDHSHRAYEQLAGMLAREPAEVPVLEVMGQLVERHPEDALLRVTFARLAAQKKDWALAQAQAERALELEPDLTEALILRAQIQIQREQQGAALVGLAQAVKNKPTDTTLRLAYARLLVEAKEMDAARVQFQTLAKQQPDNATVLYSLALLALEAEQLDDAERYFRKLISLGKQLQESRYYLGYIAEVRGDADAALEWYGKVERGDQWLEVQLRMARILAEEGDLESARERLKQLRADDPSEALRIYLVEGEILSLLRRHQEAYDLYTRMLQIYPANDDVLYARSLVAEKLDLLDQMEQDLRDILARDPEDARALNALGYTLADRTDRYQEALGYIEKAAVKAPDDPAVIDSLGWVHYRLGNLELARKHLQRAYDLSGDAEIAAHLGEVLWQLGDRAGAEAVWREARESQPENDVLERTIQRFLP